MKIIFLILFFIPIILTAETKNYTAIQTQQAPKIDGIINDFCWQEGQWETGFVQFEPNSGLEPSQKTEFKILYDNDNIYVAIRCFDTKTEKINKQLSRRDAGLGDMIAVAFDSYYDKRTAFFFGVSAAGVKNDILFSNDGNTEDASWDPVWFVKTNTDSLGWTAEMKIPLSQLRFNPSSEIWGLNIIRTIYRNNETVFWSPVDPSSTGMISQFGQMNGMDNLKPKKNIEISPYFVSGIKRYQKEDGNPYADGFDFLENIGLDGKVGLTNDFTLDFTLNPDFGQVEADPSVVNLSAFETYYSEKRPFFIENNNITQFPLGWNRENLFYSRRIGRYPQGDPEIQDGEYIKIPENTRILGAFKLSGKSQNGWSVGVIESVTNHQFAKIMQVDGVERKESVDPYTNYFVARVQKDMNKGNSIFGMILTSVYRDIRNQNLDFLNKTATTGGVDFSQYFLNKKYYVNGSAVITHITGSQNAMLNEQTSSARYFQRPDASYLAIDSLANSMTGSYANLALGKSALKGLRYELSFWYRSPKLETNDMGYLQNTDYLTQIFWMDYQTPKSFGIINNFSAHLSQWYFVDNGFNYLHSGFDLSFGTVFKNLWQLHFNLDYNFKGVSNDLLRGGTSFYMPRQINYYAYISTNNKSKFSVSLNAFLSKGDYNSTNGQTYSANFTYRPFDKFNLSVNTSFGNRSEKLQYFDEFDYLNKYYLFSTLEQKTLDLTFRFELNFTPDLSLQYYGAPFISTGKFYDYKIVTDPHASDFADRYRLLDASEINNQDYTLDINKDGLPDYEFSNPDFNFQQFRSNLVLRWEYIPGSVLFVVWSHEQSNVEETDVFNITENFKSLFTVFPTDILLVKLQYKFL